MELKRALYVNALWRYERKIIRRIYEPACNGNVGGSEKMENLHFDTKMKVSRETKSLRNVNRMG